MRAESDGGNWGRDSWDEDNWGQDEGRRLGERRAPGSQRPDEALIVGGIGPRDAAPSVLPAQRSRRHPTARVAAPLAVPVALGVTLGVILAVSSGPQQRTSPRATPALEHQFASLADINGDFRPTANWPLTPRCLLTPAAC